MDQSRPTAKSHFWKFRKVGKTYQVQLESPADLQFLRELDPKLWVALSCPVDGLEIDRDTLALIDADQDGRVRLEEVLSIVDWTLARLAEPEALFQGKALPLAAIQKDGGPGKEIYESAVQILANIGKADAKEISVADAGNTGAIFGQSKFNGDGVITREVLEDEPLAATFDDIVTVTGAANDRNGKPGVNSSLVDTFFAALKSYQSWWSEGEKNSKGEEDVFPLGAETPSAYQALIAVEKKIDDYFARCRLAQFDERAESAMNREAALFESVAKEDFSTSREEIANLPLARVTGGLEFSLVSGINPEWTDRITAFKDKVVDPLSEEASEKLTLSGWTQLRGRFSRFRAWHEAKPATGVEALGIQRIQELLASDHEEKLKELLAKELTMSGKLKAVAEVEKLARMNRDLMRLLRNFVNFSDFYEENQEAVFQAGTLYFDGRECRLCIRIDDPGKHAVLGGLSRTFVAYCECRRKDYSGKFNVAAIVSAGDSANLLVGRNGIFRDRSGKLWDANVVKIVENPISIREAFFLPYIRVGRFISEQFEKWATSRDKAMQQKMEAGVAKAADKSKSPGFGQVGGIAALLAAGGIALGAIGAGIASLFEALGSLRYWELPLVILGLILIISLPSMFIAWMRLRKRTLAPLLDAAGWAVNGKTHISFRLGKLLTRRAILPPGAVVELAGGAAARTWLWGLLGFTVIASAVGWGWILYS